MTREEIIDFCEMKAELEPENEDIFNYIVKTIEKEHCEDAVNRQQAIEFVNEVIGGKNELADAIRDGVEAVLSAMPSVKPVACIATVKFSKEDMQELVNEKMKDIVVERKKGEWCKQNDDYFDWYECSECGYGSEGEMQYSSEYDVRTKFCPNCGAEMGVEE